MKEDTMHISIIDLLRGLAALSVCLFHFVCTITGYIQDNYLLNIFKYGKMGVQVFFIISGIVIPLSMISGNYSYRSFPKFISKRFIRIEPPYLAAVLLGIIFLVLRNYIPGSAPIDMTPSKKDILLHIGYLVPFFEGAKWINPVFWTLSIEFQYYLSLALIFPLVLNNKISVRMIFYAIILIGPFVITSTAFFPYWSAYFGLGVLYLLHKTKKINAIEFSLMFFLCCSVVWIQQSFVNLFVAILTLLIIHFFGNFKSSIGKMLGNISYSFYLLHAIIGAAFINFMSHRYTEPYQKFIVITAGVLLSMISAFFFYKFIEKPSQRISKRIKY